ncbi:GvpL/GvpF family gas vesicle protein [Micromonospora sp. NPDC049679]|uniref:GvpL/GvpF family gas vesicle protein n=1 Tax=Micromonospora sp. NPDC049679 TaxID=3155920 RepID=UPI0033CCC3C5
MTGNHGVWLHLVARDLDPRQIVGLTGVGGAPLRAVEAGGLIGVVGTVDLDEFGEEPLRRNLENLPWLETVARAHHDVAQAVGRFGPVAPTRLATVYHDDTRVASVLAQRRTAFTAALDRVAGRTEWGVKAYAAAGTGAAAARPVPAGGGASPGMAYLQRRRAQLSASEAAQRAAVNGADEVHTALERHAEAGRRHKPQDERLTGAAGWNVLNGAYLVDAARAEEFATLVRQLGDAHPGLRLELTGPWPPYSFAVVEDEVAGGDAAGAGKAWP